MDTETLETPTLTPFDKQVMTVIEHKMKSKEVKFIEKRDWLASYLEKTYPGDIQKSMYFLDRAAQICSQS